MCGLAGFSGQKIDPLAMKFLLLENEKRGRHSTGVYGESMYKKAEAATVFIKQPDLADALGDATAVVGHTRFATMGAHSEENAHPYLIEHNDQQIVGTHNGFLIDQSVERAKREFNFLTEMPVDSMTIFELIIKSGWDYDTISRLDGAMALAFIDNDGLLNLYRRQSRPLYLGVKDGDLYYSSLDSALDLIDVEDSWEMPTGAMLKFDEGKLVESFKVADPDIKSIPLDCGPSSWRTDLTAEERSVYPLSTSSYGSSSRYGGHGRSAQDEYYGDGYDDWDGVSSYGASGHNQLGFDYRRNRSSSRNAGQNVGLEKLLTMSESDMKKLFHETESMMDMEFEESPAILRALRSRVLDVIDEGKEIYKDRIELQREDNGFNDLCIINFKLKNYAGIPLSDYYILCEDDLTLDGITTAEGEAVIPITRKSELTNSCPLWFQLQSIYTDDDYRVCVNVEYRKTIEVELELTALAVDADIDNRRIRRLVNELPFAPDPVQGSEDAPTKVEDRDGMQTFFDEPTEVKKERFDAWAKENYELIGKLAIPYWKALHFNSALDMEIEFFKWLRTEKRIIAFSGYSGPSYDKSAKRYLSNENFYRRINYVNDNLRWEAMTAYERSLREQFSQHKRKRVVLDMIGEFTDDVEVLSALGLSNVVSSYEVDYLEELIDQGEEIKELCEVVSGDFDTKYGSDIHEYVDNLIEVVRKHHQIVKQ